MVQTSHFFLAMYLHQLILPNKNTYDYDQQI